MAAEISVRYESANVPCAEWITRLAKQDLRNQYRYESQSASYSQTLLPQPTIIHHRDMSIVSSIFLGLLRLSPQSLKNTIIAKRTHNGNRRLPSIIFPVLRILLASKSWYFETDRTWIDGIYWNKDLGTFLEHHSGVNVKLTFGTIGVCWKHSIPLTHIS